MDTNTSHVITSSSQVRDTYYDRPVIKAPHWKWLIVNYFFLGGLTGGSFTIGAVAGLTGRNRALVRAARYLSFAALLPCPPLLILDLGRPERFLNMLRIVKLRSPMSLGSWALSGLGAFASAAAALQMLADRSGHSRWPKVQLVVGLMGLPFSIFVSGYTGLLLAITNVPLWARNYLLMGPLFVASAFSTSLAAIGLVLDFSDQEDRKTAQALAQAETICLATEIGVLATCLVRLGRLGRPLTVGTWGRLFWPVTVFAGLLSPLALQLAGPIQGRETTRVHRTVAAILALSGGYTLRMLMLFAGKESANRPADYFEFTSRPR